MAKGVLDSMKIMSSIQQPHTTLVVLVYVQFLMSKLFQDELCMCMGALAGGWTVFLPCVRLQNPAPPRQL